MVALMTKKPRVPLGLSCTEADDRQTPSTMPAMCCEPFVKTRDPTGLGEDTWRDTSDACRLEPV